MIDNTSPPLTCRICGGTQTGSTVQVREMMFGTGEEFGYFFCGDCGTFQIAQIPPDMGPYYGSTTYYSFIDRRHVAWWKRLLTRLVAGYIVGRPDRLAKANPAIARIALGSEPWIAEILGLTRGSSLLDVGCGEGARLNRLAELGFTDLQGVDPFLPSDKAGRTEGGVELFKRELADLAGPYDVITMHHSLEHFADPLATLELARERITPDGRVFVHVPLMQQAIWDRFGTNWAQIDAPRHFYLFTPKSVRAMARKAGFAVESMNCDGPAWSLVWSESYARGVAMFSPEGRANDPPLSDAEAMSLGNWAQELNEKGEGDQGWFVLKRV